jgi:formylglycine-generating enzyme required for sulfatase activity
MKRCIAMILSVALLLGIGVTVVRAAWRMRIHKGATIEEHLVATVDSLSFDDPDPGVVGIPAGVFTMGSPVDEPGRGPWDETEHQVVLTIAILVSVLEVTQTEWQAVMGWNASEHQGPNHPVENVTWFDGISYCNRRSAAEGLDSVYVMTDRYYSGVHITGATSVTCDWAKSGYRLPTEAEWEYACRATTTTAFCNGAITYTECSPPDPKLDQIGWYCGNSGVPRDVGAKDANGWGIKDMHGNAWEWCWDRFDVYPSGPVTDPTGPLTGERRVLRGGSGTNQARLCRSAMRNSEPPSSCFGDVGLRVVRTAQ